MKDFLNRKKGFFMRKKVYWETSNAKDSQTFLDLLGETLQQDQIIQDVDQFVKDVDQREQVASTVVSPTLAIPHVCSGNVLQAEIVFVKLPVPLRDWDQDHHLIDRIILTVLPKEINSSDRQACTKFFSQLGRKEVLKIASHGDQQAITKLMQKSGDNNDEWKQGQEHCRHLACLWHRC